MSEELTLILFAIFLVVLVALSAFFSGFESAINSLSRYQFETYYKKHKKNSTYKVVSNFLDDMQMAMSAVLLWNTLVNIGASTLSTIFFTNLVTYLGGTDAQAMGAGLATGIMTFLTLIFGEFIPKVVARRNNLLYIRLSAWPMYCFFIFTWPISWLLTRIFKEKQMSLATENELDTLVELIEKEGVLESKEASLVRNAIKFDETRITSIMTKIDKIVFIKTHWSKERIKETFINNSHSRLPIMRKDKIIGFVTFRDFFTVMEKLGEFQLTDIIKPVVYVSQYHTLDDVLQEMQIQQCHLAIVKKNVDSSIIMGIITLEDLMEELVGEIYDESDPTKSITIINDFTWRVNEDVNAASFLNKQFKYAGMVDETINIKEWVRKKFQVKRFVENDKYENAEMVVTVRKNKNFTENKLIFIIQKKNYH